MAARDLTGAIDFARLEAYAGGDDELVEEVLGLFHEQAAVWVRLLEGTADGAGFRDAAHTLKGSALGLCADGLATACTEAEASAGAEAGLRSVLAARVHDEVDRVLTDAATWRHDRMIRSLKG